jgi:hypothetical protein
LAAAAASLERLIVKAWGGHALCSGYCQECEFCWTSFAKLHALAMAAQQQVQDKQDCIDWLNQANTPLLQSGSLIIGSIL